MKHIKKMGRRAGVMYGAQMTQGGKILELAGNTLASASEKAALLGTVTGQPELVAMGGSGVVLGKFTEGFGKVSVAGGRAVKSAVKGKKSNSSSHLSSAKKESDRLVKFVGNY